jgi:hypothetical protein
MIHDHRLGLPTLKNIMFFMFAVLLWGCAPTRSDTSQKQPVFRPPTIVPTETPQPTATPAPKSVATPTCTNNLKFVRDVSIPDGATVKAGEALEKTWEVENTGTCSWDDRYRLQLIGGPDLGVAKSQALFPARAGSRVEIKLKFSAPLTGGRYHSAWQAYSAEGVPFGDPIFIEVFVSK